jgi:hypothetical protein
VQQQQGGAYGSLSFSSQFGTFGVDSLPIVSPIPPAPPVYEPAPPAWQPPAAPSSPVPPSLGAPQSQAEILSSLERLGQLFHQGVLTESEFKIKKADLLARL